MVEKKKTKEEEEPEVVLELDIVGYSMMMNCLESEY
jgi:hypothetical protein